MESPKVQKVSHWLSKVHFHMWPASFQHHLLVNHELFVAFKGAWDRSKPAAVADVTWVCLKYYKQWSWQVIQEKQHPRTQWHIMIIFLKTNETQIQNGWKRTIKGEQWQTIYNSVLCHQIAIVLIALLLGLSFCSKQSSLCPKNHDIMGSKNWWFGDPRPLRKTHPNKPLFFAGLPVILRVDCMVNTLKHSRHLSPQEAPRSSWHSGVLSLSGSWWVSPKNQAESVPCFFEFHQHVQVPKMEESSPKKSCMDTAYVRESIYTP